jgi:prolyl oligopeptidase
VTLVDWQKAKPTRRVLIPASPMITATSAIADRPIISNQRRRAAAEGGGDRRRRGPAQQAYVIAEQPETLSGTSLVGGKIIASYLKDAATEVRVHSLAGARERVIELPGLGTAGGFSGDLDDPETFFRLCQLQSADHHLPL